MCSWCWGFRPTWLEFRQKIPQNLNLVTLVGGLAPDSDQPMVQGLRDGIQQAWHQIQQVIPGTEFNFDFWTDNTPRRSTYPACRAVIAARHLNDMEDEMTLAIQQAYYLKALNPSDLSTLTDAAVQIGLDKDAFVELMTGSSIDDMLSHELAKVRSIGVSSFPSLVLEAGMCLKDIKVDYNHADRMLEQINSALESS
jgi:putative protein-disulfide isomerase